MPDLGQYAVNVLGAYIAGLVLLIGLTVLSIARARKVKAQLRQLESERKKNG
jgi:heme exporter protein D